MRWLVLHPGPSWSVADVFNGWTEALEALGEKVFTYDLDRRLQFFTAALFETGQVDEHGHLGLRRACTREEAVLMAAEPIGSLALRHRPHVVLGISAFFTPPGLLQALRDAGIRVVLLHTEVPYQDDEQLVRAEFADLNLVNDPVSISRYRAFGPAEYMPHAYRPQVHHPGAAVPGLKSDLCFVGTGFPSRQKFLERMDLDGLDVLLAGGWPGLPLDSPLRTHLLDPEQQDITVENMRCLDNDVTADIYRSGRAGLNLYRQEGEEAWDGRAWAVGPREVEMAACGLPFARDRRGESDELFPMLPSFTTPAEAGEQVRWLLADEARRERAAVAARAAIADRTFENHAKRLLRLLEKKGQPS
jgi:spore maturation protein CgeB